MAACYKNELTWRLFKPYSELPTNSALGRLKENQHKHLKENNVERILSLWFDPCFILR